MVGRGTAVSCVDATAAEFAMDVAIRVPEMLDKTVAGAV
jgi:hypothetical protein